MVLLQKMETLSISAVISQHVKLYLHTALDCDVECLILKIAVCWLEFHFCCYKKAWN